MALKINVPDSANTQSNVSLGGSNYLFDFTFNDRDGRYRLTISLNGESVISGLKLIENVIITQKYDLPDFDHGELLLVKIKDTTDPAGRNNIGIGKAYELIYLSNEELAALGG
jgi:hypothetical protein